MPYSAINHVLSVVIILLYSSISFAASPGAGTSGGTFLKIDVGARPAAMGGAFTAVADDVNTLHYNPAGLHSVRRPSISTMHAEWLLDINYDFIGLALPIGSRNTLGSSIILLNTKDTRRGVLGTVLETFKIQDIAFTAGDAFQINNAFTVGFSAKYISQTLFHSTANAFAFDAGVKYFSPIPGFELGMSFQNLGTQLKFEREGDPLLNIFRFGAVYRFLDDRFIVSGDLVKPRGLSVQGNVGMEFNYHDLIYLRGGYRINQNLPGADALSLGLGLRYRSLTFDYAFAPFGDLGNTHRFSGGLAFGKKVVPRKKTIEEKPVRITKKVSQEQKRTAVSKPLQNIAMLDFTGDIENIDSFNDALFNKLNSLENFSLLDRDIVQDKIIEAESLELDKLPEILGVEQVIFGTMEYDGHKYTAEINRVFGDGNITMDTREAPDIQSLLARIADNFN